MRWLVLIALVLLCGVEADAQTQKAACQAMQLLPQLQEIAAQLAQLTGGGGYITIPLSLYERLQADARELALLQLELEPSVRQLHLTSDYLESNLIH